MRNDTLAILGVAILVFGVSWQSVVGSDPDGTSNLTEQSGQARVLHPMWDLLWMIDHDREHMSLELRRTLEALDASRVPGIAEARQAALHFRPPLSALEGYQVVGLIRIGREVPKFAKQGDLVWIVNAYQVDQFGVTQELWISSTTGQVRAMLPLRDK
jgi:hypothetical protein